ncbi:hypothetical protein ACKVWC_011464 [Pyricularia oryzae]
MENPVTVSSPLSRPTDSDRRGLVVVVAIFFIVIIIISIGIQILIRRRGASQSFDWLLYIGAVLMLAHSACYAYSVSFGLGLPKEDEDIDVNAVHKIIYTTSALGISAVFCAKLYMCILIKRINDYGYMFMATRALAGLVVTAFVSGFLCAIFQCALPEPWVAESKSQCVAAARIYLYNGVMNVTTDVFLVILSIAMVWHVQLPQGKNKGLIIALFGFRILCPIAAIPSLLSTEHLYSENDFTWLAVQPVIWQLVSYSLSIIAACIPSLKYIFDSFGGFTLAVEPPYALTKVGTSGFEPTAIDSGGSSNHIATFGSTGAKGGDGGLWLARSQSGVQSGSVHDIRDYDGANGDATDSSAHSLKRPTTAYNLV